MPFQISPGVNVTEIDLTTIVPAVATTEGAIAGVFKWGPIGERVLVDTENKLVTRFGKPSSHNPETFFTAANFLGYGNRLYVSRAANTTGGTSNNVMSALANVGSVSVPTNFNIKNEDDYNSKRTAGDLDNDTDVIYIAKYPGSFGNSLKVSVCDSANAWSTTSNLIGTAINSTATSVSATVGSNTITVSVVPSSYSSNVTAANTSANSARASLTLGDVLEVGNNTVGKQYLRITSIGSLEPAFYQQTSGTYSSGVTQLTVSDTTGYSVGANVSGTGIPSGSYIVSVDSSTTFTISSNTTGTSATLTITNPANFEVTVDNLVRTKSDWSATSLTRYWEFFGSFDSAPDQSTYLSNLVASNPSLYSSVSAVKDEMHVVVVDEDGEFTGVPGAVLEKFGSLSRIKTAKNEQGASVYYVDAINNGSQYMWWANDRSGSPSANTADLVSDSTNSKPLSLSFSGGQDGDDESDIDPVDLYNAIDLFASAEDIDISLVLQGKARGGDKGQQYANYVIDNICEKRKDCVLFVSPNYEAVINNLYQEVDDVIAFRNSLTSTSYAVLDSGYKYQYDRYNDVYRWVPLNGDIAGLCARTDNIRDPWFSPAGFNRGIIKNVVKLAYNPAKAERDSLYKADVNPVINVPGTGTILYGDKTILGKPSAFDRINVRRLFIVLEKAIATASKYTLFEFNDAFTRAQFRNLIEPYLRDIQGRRGIYDFRVVCDDSNNTAEVIDRNEFIGDIYIKPARSINFIQLNFVAVRTGVNFNEIVGFRA